ncbi:MAG: heme exporter protein CcmB [Litorimonas sp.]
MSALSTIIRRDMRLAARSGGAWSYGLVFMVFFLALCAIALGGNSQTLKPLSIPLIWLAILFSSLLSISQIFRGDMEDGSLVQLKLSGLTSMTIASAKTISFALIYLFPLIITTPIWGQLFGLGGVELTGLLMALLVALPAIAVYVAVSGAILCAKQSGGFLAIILTAPLLIPTLIFGVLASQKFSELGLATPELRILTGLSFLSIAIGLPASAAALSANLEG